MAASFGARSLGDVLWGRAGRGGDGCTPLGTLQQRAHPFGNPAGGTNRQGLRGGHLPGDLDWGTRSKAGSRGIRQGTRWEGFSGCVPLDTLWGRASKGVHPLGDALQGWRWVHPFGDKLAVGAPLGDMRRPTGCPLPPLPLTKSPAFLCPDSVPLAGVEAV